MRGEDHQLVVVEDRHTLEGYLSQDRSLHIYELGDLDPAFWPRTSWWGLKVPSGGLCGVALLYRGAQGHTVIALGARDPVEAMLLRLEAELPEPFYAHLSLGAAEVLDGRRSVSMHGPHLKMALRDPAPLAGADVSGVEPLGPADLDEVLAFYARAHPLNWFDPRMLDTGLYVGVRRSGRLACVAGVHVHSPAYRVAALGNIATDPAHRGRGLARRATARLCQRLFDTVDIVGLNVRADNAPAIACYRRLGFQQVAAYDECSIV